MLFSQFAESLELIEGESSRLAMTSHLAELFKKLEPNEAGLACYLLQGELLPPYKNLEFSLSDRLVMRAIALLVGENGGFEQSGVAIDIFGQQDESFLISEIKKLFQKSGDLGEATKTAIIESAGENRAGKLSITETYEALVEIATISGEGSQDEKIYLLKNLLNQVTPLSAKYIVRIILGKMRLGFSLMTMLDSFSWAATNTKEESKFLEDIYQRKADVGKLAEEYLNRLSLTSQERQKQLSAHYQVEVGVPIVPALCQRLNSAHEIIEKMTDVLAEPKYDGMRVQIHINGDKINAFTRSLEDISHMYPELKTLAKNLPIKNIILDSEVVGYNKESGKLLPFQETITRRRKHDIENKAKDVPVRFFVFDILYLDGQDLMHKELLERKEILKKLWQADSTEGELTPYITTQDAGELKNYHEQLLREGLEGAVIKQIDSTYQSGRKGWQWVKIKEEEGSRGMLNDTLDLVVMGYYFGKGKRKDFGIGAFLTGLLDNEGKIVTISKIGTGITDDEFRDLKKHFGDFESADKPNIYEVDKNLLPDVWLTPEIVVEIAADEITRSTFHTSGYGLRFPRLIKVRDDKTNEQATKTSELSGIIIKRD
ncbi:MAG: ATP-dependent DNA ligase [Pseudomonadales bacterium]|jgi:DNA ligase-1|nr:ATP-dependent DNA ligase [Pseudomonadales bacterium]